MMARLIKNNAVIDDAWTSLALNEGDDPATVTLPAGSVLFPLAVWLARKDEILARTDALGLLLQGNDPVEEIGADAARFSVIAIHFPKFVDGRGYSAASLLRRRYGYTGELRAVGDVLHDQLFYMKRVGFDAFALREDKSADYAVEKGFNAFSERYQVSTDQAQPLFRRRAA